MRYLRSQSKKSYTYPNAFRKVSLEKRSYILHALLGLLWTPEFETLLAPSAPYFWRSKIPRWSIDGAYDRADRGSVLSSRGSVYPLPDTSIAG
jgi:hypothetical protein